MLRNEKGLTLIELLAVVVILGIIAAIAVPSIGKIIENSKKDAHLANAQQMVSSGKLALASNPELVGDDNQVTLGELQTNGFLEDNIKHPHGEVYDTTNSYVVVSTNNVTEVILLTTENSTNGVYNVDEGNKTPVPVNSLNRESVKPTN